MFTSLSILYLIPGNVERGFKQQNRIIVLSDGWEVKRNLKERGGDILQQLRNASILHLTPSCTLPEGQHVPPLDWAETLTCWTPHIDCETPTELSRTLTDREESGTGQQRTLHIDTMKSLLCSLLYSASLLMSDVLATYQLNAGDPHLISAQSYAQSRNNGRPPTRTLNPASMCDWSHFTVSLFYAIQFANF